MSPGFFVKIPNPEIQTREIPDPERSIKHYLGRGFYRSGNGTRQSLGQGCVTEKNMVFGIEMMIVAKKNESGMRDQVPLSRSCNHQAFLSVLKFGIHGNK